MARGISERGRHAVRVLALAEITLQDCRGCYACQERGACVFRKDDIALVEEAIQWADMLILATPTHWGNISGLLLRMFERLFGFLIRERPNAFPVALHAKGKKAVVITACSTAWPFNWVFNQTRAVKSRIKEVCRYSGIRVVGTVVYPGTLTKKDIPARYLERARRYGMSL